MADEPEQDEEVLTLTEEAEDEALEQDEEQQPEEQEDDGEEVVVGFADEQPAEDEPESDNKVVRQMRQRIRELEKQVKQAAPPAPAKIEIPPKPTLESCDYDEETYDAKKAEWDGLVAKAKEQETEAEKAEQSRREVWESRAQRYTESKAKIGAPVDDAAVIVDEALGANRSPVLLLAQDPAALTLALSRSPTKLKELADAKDDFELAYLVGKLEGGVRVERRKRTPAVDRPVGGNASTTLSTADATLKRLEDKAAKTGDRTEVVRFKAKLKEQGK